ncbi:cytochrome c551 [Lysobacter helvus]|uniref:Cytochrome c551 n=2 Tax=Lysobacteraceae TaxID=32033 RepID=A0ABM7Q8Z8_9GAMM|nr:MULTISPECIES: cation transporter [Lysobacter]BCT93927.1 cytochrome c551 [Lysobacter caseinilyticus]BCT97083.1 cytochrome c551 [Lysobacter helvus]
MDTRAEQRLLRASIFVTTLVGAGALIAGWILNASAIMFDGIYSLIDVLVTTGSLTVSRLLSNPASRRFQYGFWHLEPLVETVGGAILATACVYAGIDAVEGLLRGGHVIEFGTAIAWAATLGVVGIGMSTFMRRQSRRLGSPLLAMDSRTWMVSAMLSFALLAGFGLAIAMAGTRFARWIPLVDPAVLLAVSMVTLPVPLLGTVRAFREILQVAPTELDRKVRAVMDAVMAERGFLDYASHVQKVGRGQFIEIHVLLPDTHVFSPISMADALRDEIAARLGEDTATTWLTIDFTGDRAWL